MLKHRQARTKTESLQNTINDYMEATGEQTIDMNKVAAWAIGEGRWKPPEYDPRKMCARELSRAAREEFYTDPQGREVRKKHCYTIVDEQGQHRWLWVDIQTAKPDQIRKSAAARRRSALGDVVQLHTDVSSYNDNNPYGASIQMSFNFDEDIAELGHPEEYPEEGFGDDET